MIAQLLHDAAVAITAAVALEDLLDEVAHAGVLLLGGSGRGGMIKAAAGQPQSQADLADAGTGLGTELEDHLAGLDGG